ncbi:MAG: deoxyribodipyrimidine photo-lyase [Deltaproteobacteria bacterium]|nr:deoxyribodipyrimidine photo-lyase [Deltaproteobacteria bacterium]
MDGSVLKAAFIFRRDLRLSDNTGLMAALHDSDSVLPCFILDPVQVEPHPFRSEFAFQFMLESLVDLDTQLKKKSSRLFVFRGKPTAVVSDLIKAGIQTVHVNRDYTPFSHSRDSTIQKVCKEAGVRFVSHADALLFEPEEIGRHYKVYSAFRRFTEGFPERLPHCSSAVHNARYYRGKWNDLGIAEIQRLQRPIPKKSVAGGRRAGLTLLSKIKNLHDYSNSRDLPAVNGTSLLSAHHKFGTVSIRESATAADSAFGPDSVFYRELLWRDFFTHVAVHRPDVFGHAFNKKYDGLSWRGESEAFNRWCRGETGFPIVDAGMRQLNRTGYMHNRVRMIVASFLTKDLRVDWRLGERYFASKLVDYDPCVNNGNWQWAASTGCDAQPYFRIFNPWRQQQRFDSRCEYIKKWVPELNQLSPREIHGLEKSGLPPTASYPCPMVDHGTESALTLKMFKHLL